MSELPQGTPQPSEQPAYGIPNTEQAPAEGQQPPATPTPQPSVEELQRSVQQERQRAEHAESQYRALQPEYTRARQALAQLAGAAPQPQAPTDPREAAVRRLVTEMNYPEKAARDTVDLFHTMLAPVQQQNQQLQQQLAVTAQASQVDHHLGQAMQFDPSLFPDQATANQVRSAALDYVRQGGQLDHRLIVSMANDAAYWQRRNAPPQPPPGYQQPQYQPYPATVPQPQPFANGQFRVQPGFAPAQPQQAPITPEQKAAEDYIRTRFPNPPTR